MHMYDLVTLMDEIGRSLSRVSFDVCVRACVCVDEWQRTTVQPESSHLSSSSTNHVHVAVDGSWVVAAFVCFTVNLI
jgi:hypothetical protein